MIEDIKNRMDPKYANMMFSCPPEWVDLVVELDQELAKIDPNYKVRQVKSKFGGLRYYVTASENTTPEQRLEMHDLISKAESKSWTLV